MDSMKWQAVLVVSFLVAGCGIAPAEEQRLAFEEPEQSQAELEFLSDIPEFRHLHLGITEEEVFTIAASEELEIRRHEVEEGSSFTLSRKDGENVIVMFSNGKCSGIQRMRPGIAGEVRLEHSSLDSPSLNPTALEEVRSLIARLETEHGYNAKCGTVVMHIAASIERFGDSGWNLVAREFSDPGYALSLRETLQGIGE